MTGYRLQPLWNQGWLLLTLASLFWAGNSIVGRAVNETVPPVGLAFWRWVAASLIVLPFAWPHVRRDWPKLRKAWLLIAALAVLGLAGFNVVFYTALHHTTAINSVLLQSATPPLILLLTFLLFRERPLWTQILGLVVSIAGVLVILAEGAPDRLLALRLNVGDALVMACVVGYALYSALLKKAPPLHPLSFLAGTFVASVVVLIPLYVVEHLSGDVMPTDGASLAALAYVALFPSIAAYLFFNRGVEIMGANRAGQYMHLMPAFGALLAVAFLDERFRLFHALGMALIAAGIVLSSRGAKETLP